MPGDALTTALWLSVTECIRLRWCVPSDWTTTDDTGDSVSSTPVAARV